MSRITIKPGLRRASAIDRSRSVAGVALPAPAQDFVDRASRRPGFTIDPPPLDNTKPNTAPVRPVASVNSANVSQRLLILTTTGIVGQEGVAILEADPNRRYLEIFNLDGAAVVTLGFNQLPAIGLGRPILAGGVFAPPVVPTNTIYAIASIPNATILVLYG